MTTTANKIQDFGAKIGGARKDLYAEAREFAETYACLLYTSPSPRD